jgi:hypothetical protein
MSDGPDTFTRLGDAVARVVAGVGRVRRWPGAPIRDPGIYAGVPIEVYHGAALCNGPSISSSGLRTIENESPAHYWCRSPYNPDREPEEPSDALDFGKAAHVLLLGESGFREHFALRPAEWSDWRTAAAKQWRDDMRAAGRTVLTPDQVDVIRKIARSLERHPVIAGGLLNGEIEQTMVWKDPVTGVWLKARPDALPRDRMLVDLKTCASADRQSVSRALADHGYHMQLALAGMGLEALTGEAPGNDDYVLVFVEKAAPYAVNIKPIDAEAIWYGRRQLRRAIDTFARCLESGEWPAYGDDLSPVYLPAYYQKRLEQEAEDGRLPEEKAA